MEPIGSTPPLPIRIQRMAEAASCLTMLEECMNVKLIKASLLAVLVSGAVALPVQNAGAATGCTYHNGHRVCGTTAHHPKTVCTTHNGVRHCRKVY